MVRIKGNEVIALTKCRVQCTRAGCEPDVLKAFVSMAWGQLPLRGSHHVGASLDIFLMFPSACLRGRVVG